MCCMSWNILWIIVFRNQQLTSSKLSDIVRKYIISNSHIVYAIVKSDPPLSWVILPNSVGLKMYTNALKPLNEIIRLNRFDSNAVLKSCVILCNIIFCRLSIKCVVSYKIFINKVDTCCTINTQYNTYLGRYAFPISTDFVQ